ncbi:MAG: 23S rRNA (guanosine(2251)-2'-O)-methyltransferase RlmB [Bacteroidales bacterium]|jgi:23S rRNA (guanosine2251-2'-O)-methyltransferase|nr:23S rRNA (guanosine(2251)-2'-O)-methyltransferase RlmB [Bacteroidales bacterium]MDD2687950.1 23S rRNA (guanosine(2251)-2'-O)-methyltransferase RlmB [Bacteroidales bacterium]MDD3330549.1 23S rRNA (guanosine(2251)-2'-O)-methyltransferase RlmB [Bacteroidales bacterium]MDD3691492.1 23S rRNA (guanosine(2251)-2'-O)-methyltransferase RlmB [Bacteroidales bacterium]MDD4045077.1 23S rRNA (guanosine(2251)-2'-O)-methyltransferase RlmB [Bacteroidales bacterium]
MYKYPRPKNANLIYGLRPVIEAIHEQKDIDKILLQKGASGDLFRELFQMIREQNIPFQYVPMERLNRLTGGNHQGVICFMSSISYQSIYDIVPGIYEQAKVPFLLFLDRITDVRNMGAIARTAECASVDAIVFPSKHSAQLNEDAVKTSAGALHKIPICRHDDVKEVLTYIKQCGIQLMACTEKAKQPYYKTDFTRPICVVMGNEGEGISPEILTYCDQSISISMHGSIDSLNVSVATGIILFEVMKQRTVS